jgi:hypothetical protein
MTERYMVEVEALKEWFKESLAAFPALDLTQDEYKAGLPRKEMRSDDSGRT